MPKYYKKDLLSEPHRKKAHISRLQADDLNPFQVLHEWRAANRPFRKKDRSYFTTVAVLVVVFSPFAFIFGGVPLFLALMALGFVSYVFNLVPPEEVMYRLSTQGITVDDQFYHWNELDSFWLAKKDSAKVLHILTHLNFPGMLMLVVPDEMEDKVTRICARYLPFREIPPKSFVEKAAESLQKHFPLENVSKR